MKTYKVYVNIERQEIEVEADSEDEAEDLAFEQMQSNLLLSDCTFDTELIEGKRQTILTCPDICA